MNKINLEIAGQGSSNQGKRFCCYHFLFIHFDSERFETPRLKLWDSTLWCSRDDYFHRRDCLLSGIFDP